MKADGNEEHSRNCGSNNKMPKPTSLANADGGLSISSSGHIKLAGLLIHREPYRQASGGVS
jgi:hypothetical protein